MSERISELLGDMHVLELQVERLEAKNDHYKKALEQIPARGHNLECIFCGFKDRLAKEALNPEKSDPKEL